ncbi:MAG: sensor histidine kinase [Bdellovibrionota bacterium]
MKKNIVKYINSFLYSKPWMILIFLLFVTYVFFYFTMLNINKLFVFESNKILKTKILSATQAIELWSEHSLKSVSLILKYPGVRSNIDNMLHVYKNDYDKFSKYRDRVRNDILPVLEDSMFNNIYILSKSQTVIMSLNDDENKSFKTESDKEFWEEINRGKKSISKLLDVESYLDSFENELEKSDKDRQLPKILVGSPIFGKNGEIIASIAFETDLSVSLYKTLTSDRIGESGETYILKRDGTIATPSRFEEGLIDIGLIKKDETSAMKIKAFDPGCNLTINDCKPNKLKSLTVAADECLNQSKAGLNTEGYNDYRGITVIGAWKPINLLGACLVSEIDYDERYEVLNSIQYILWSLFVLVEGAIIGFAVFNARMRQKINNQRLQAQLANTEKLVSLGEMAGSLAHEINSPLSAVLLNLDNLSDVITDCDPSNESDKQMAKDIMTKIDKSIHSISRIVQGIKFFSRLKSGDPFVKINIIDVIDESLSICENSLSNHSIKLNFSNQTSAIYINGNMTGLMQVFVNLLNNSKDALVELGKNDLWISIDVRETSDDVIIEFKDCGDGVPEKVRSKIFNPFFTTKDVGKGTGLGLGISLNVVESHGGSLTLDEKSLNTCFVIKLPRFDMSGDKKINI